jgi:hypothetical protein
MSPEGSSWLPLLGLCALVAGCARSTQIADPLPELRSAFPLKMPLNRANASLTARGARITIYAPSECAALLQEPGQPVVHSRGGTCVLALVPVLRPRFFGTRGDVIAELAFGPDELLADVQFSNVIYTFL